MKRYVLLSMNENRLMFFASCVIVVKWSIPLENVSVAATNEQKLSILLAPYSAAWHRVPSPSSPQEPETHWIRFKSINGPFSAATACSFLPLSLIPRPLRCSTEIWKEHVADFRVRFCCLLIYFQFYRLTTHMIYLNFRVYISAVILRVRPLSFLRRLGVVLIQTIYKTGTPI